MPPQPTPIILHPHLLLLFSSADPCPSPQCANNERDSCCRRGDGKDCTRLGRWEGEGDPKGWMGRDLDGTGGEEAAGQEAAAAEEQPAKQDRQQNKPRRGGGDEQEGGGGGQWQDASATVFWSYPDCCHDSGADQTECSDYSGCKWEVGAHLFASPGMPSCGVLGRRGAWVR